MSLGNRIKEIRDDHGLTQTEFGDCIGLTKASVSRAEKDIQGISDGVFKNIIKEFCVNEPWLEEGKGEKYNEKMKQEKEFMEKEFHFISASLLESQSIFFNRLRKYTEEEKLEMITILEEIYNMLNGPSDSRLNIDNNLYYQYFETVAGILFEMNRFISRLNSKEKLKSNTIIKYIKTINDDFLSIVRLFDPEVELSSLEFTDNTNRSLSENEYALLNAFRNLDPADKLKIEGMVEMKLAEKKPSFISDLDHGELAISVIHDTISTHNKRNGSKIEKRGSSSMVSDNKKISQSKINA